MIRLYGCSVGHGSFCRVTAGMRRGLESIGQFAGLVPLDGYDEEAVYPGADADIGVYVGPPGGASAMRSIGLHRQRYLLLPPNSTCVPTDLLRHVEEHVDALIAPSQWAKAILQGLTQLPVQLWRHGVDPGFHPYPGDDGPDLTRPLRVLHLASTAAQRKGTRELLEGWAHARNRGWLPPDSQLHIAVDAPTDVFKEEIGRCGGSVRVAGRLNHGVESMVALYQRYHYVACPSRGEAFGLCPLEALCCGVPVIATTCTGHSESIGAAEAGVVPIRTGDLAPIDDGPGALAPSLHAEDVATALRTAADTLTTRRHEALGTAHVRGLMCSWPAVTKQWWEQEQCR